MKGIIIIMMVIMACAVGCNDVKIGYLMTQNAKYAPDSMVLKVQLDPRDKDDARREQFQIPWQSTKIEGVQGTMPVRYEIYKINNNELDRDLQDQFEIKDGGIVELPWNHSVPEGRYVISVKISNEGHVEVLDSIFTVVVE